MVTKLVVIKKKGLVIEAYEDKEGYVRRVLLKVEDGTLSRDIRKLCLLEEEVLRF